MPGVALDSRMVSSLSAAQIIQMPLGDYNRNVGGGRAGGIPTSLFFPLGGNSEPLMTLVIVFIFCCCCNKLPWTDGSESHKYIILQFQRPEDLKSSCWQSCIPFVGFRELFPCLFQLPEIPCIPWLRPLPPSLKSSTPITNFIITSPFLALTSSIPLIKTTVVISGSAW